MQSIFTTFAFVVSPVISLRRLAIAVVSSMMLLAMNPILYVSLSLIFSAHLNVPLMARYGAQAALKGARRCRS
jgi:hypothetical protein